MATFATGKVFTNTKWSSCTFSFAYLTHVTAADGQLQGLRDWLIFLADRCSILL